MNIEDISSQAMQTDRAYVPKRMNAIDVNQSGGMLNMFNSVESGAIGANKPMGIMETTQPSGMPYQHNGQYNPNAFDNGNSVSNISSTGNSKEIASLMGQINDIEGSGGLAGLDEEDRQSAVIAITKINDVIKLITEDVDLWVPQTRNKNNVKVTEQLKVIGSKLGKHLEKYVDTIRKLG